MAHILSLPASSPLREPTSHCAIGRPGSSHGSGGSVRTVRHHRLRSLSSGSSISSLASHLTASLRRHDDLQPASRSSSAHNLGFTTRQTGPERRSASGNNSCWRSSFASAPSARRSRVDPGSKEQTESLLLEVTELDHEDDDELVHDRSIDACGGRRSESAGPRSSNVEPSCVNNATSFQSPRTSEKGGPLRWLRTLRRRKRQSIAAISTATEQCAMESGDDKSASKQHPTLAAHRKSDSWTSSLGLVTAVKSASATLASASAATMSRRNTKWRRGHQRSSVVSGSEPRQSIESQRSILDQAAHERSLKRRDKVEELIRSEESYVADIKALSNVRFTTHGIICVLTFAGILYNHEPPPHRS